MNFERIKLNYDTKLWNKSMVHKAFKMGVIDLLQYFMIVGEVEQEDIPYFASKEQVEEDFREMLAKGNNTSESKNNIETEPLS